MRRRDFLSLAGGAALAPWLSGCAGGPSLSSKGGLRVVVVGGGFGGATAAKYIRLWDPGIEVVLVERNASFVSCPQSNLVLAGARSLDQLTLGYHTLASRWGVRLVRGEVSAIDSGTRAVTLADGSSIPYDRLILSPGIDFLWDSVAGLTPELAETRLPHAWKAGPQTRLLRRQLEAMPDGGVYVLGVPKAPYRCPPGPYERASLVAAYFKQAKPRSKVLVLDGNPDITSKKGLFSAAWKELYPGLVEYRPNALVTEVNLAAGAVKTEFDTVKGEVLNIVPAQRAGKVVDLLGLATVDKRWVPIDFQTYEAKDAPGVHVLGDATQAAPAPKSGHTANNQAKVCAAAVIALLRGEAPDPEPVSANTCYSWVSPTEAVHVAAVYKYDGAKKALVAVDGTSGVSTKRSEKEARYAEGWARNIWADALL